MTGGASRRLRAFAVTQIAASFVLLAGAAMLLKTLLALQAVNTGIDTRRVLAINVPVISYGRSDGQVVDFYKEAMRRVHQLPGVDGVAMGVLTPWREGGNFGPGMQFTVEGYARGNGGRRSARPISHHLAGIFRRARRADDRRARFQRTRPQG